MEFSITPGTDSHEILRDYVSSSSVPSAASTHVLKNNQLSALASLASLLLREVEVLKTNEDRIARELESDEGIDLYHEVQKFEAAMIRSALIRTGGVQRKAAELLGLKVTTLNVKIKRYKISFDPPHGAHL
jgi:transcriptional regulator with GAF, ATPase, and Fis domain